MGPTSGGTHSAGSKADLVWMFIAHILHDQLSRATGRLFRLTPARGQPGAPLLLLGLVRNHQKSGIQNMKTPTCKMSPLGEVVGGAVVTYRGSGGDTLALVLKPEGSSVALIDLYRLGPTPIQLANLTRFPAGSGTPWCMTFDDVEVDFALTNSAIDLTTFSASALDDAGHWKPGSLAIADSGFWLLAENNTEQHNRGQLGMASLCDGTWLSAPHDKRMVAVLSNWRLVRRVGGETQELCRMGQVTAPSGL